MSTDKIIVAYDGTPHADDAIALAQLLAEASGASIALAHVYRADATSASAPTPGREVFLRRQAEQLLERGAKRADGFAERHAVAGTTTATGLRTLAQHERAAVIVFGSAYNTAPGRVHPGSAARRLLQGAGSAVAFAPVGFRERDAGVPRAIAVAHDADDSARRTAEALAQRGGGVVTELKGEPAELLVIGSRPNAERGHVMVAASAEPLIHASTSPVLVVPRGVGAVLGAARAVAA